MAKRTEQPSTPRYSAVLDKLLSFFKRRKTGWTVAALAEEMQAGCPITYRRLNSLLAREKPGSFTVRDLGRNDGTPGRKPKLYTFNGT